MLHEINAAKLRVELDGITPLIWRELTVPTDWSLDKLHLVLQAAFSWTESHLHEFLIGGLRFGDPELLYHDFDDQKVFDSSEVRLSDFVKQDCGFVYIYDFGDHWQHKITVVDWLALDPVPKHAQCVAGARATPPEDVGGTFGYEMFLEAISDPDHDENADQLYWAGGYFDPDWFDLDLINKDLRNTFRANVRRRLHQPKPKKTGKQ
ncbi:plasmid pRiA4b ORF-3 family protein [Roseinatronobacter monicus]|uniref:PRiA4b ORF-3-like protein n=1 Tax=Roseinatronobacter monicus TaxID=393481 RepID=A0A543K3S2_9RHOB|nr:plasmid pRiA4b ORF-3 family protein [Roseinatronobacter monicus]TQM89719.1 pRiA4b ORF-3-like protein [Roseinatronobacter monicus]